MTKEQQAAVERLRRLENETQYEVYGDGYTLELCQKRLTDESILAQMYLAEHPADDDEPIDDDWMRSVGGEWDDAGHCFRFRHQRLTVNLRANGQCWLYWSSTYGGKVSTYPKYQTRGAVRRLFAALGVRLKEGE